MSRALATALLVLAALPAQNDGPPRAFQVAVGLQQRGLHEEAAKQFEEFLQREKGHPLAAEAHYRLGLARLETGRNDRAIESLQMALTVGGPGFALRAECRYRLGGLFEAARDHARAVEQFAQLAKDVAADHYLLAAARYAEGEALRELGKDDLAAGAFAAAADAATGERASFRFPALYQLGFAQLRQQQLGDAAATFALAATAAPDDNGKGECNYLGGDALLRLGEFDAAERVFQRAVKLGGDFADDAAHALPWVALGRGDRRAAAAGFAAAVTTFPDAPQAASSRLEHGRALYQDGKPAEAAPILQPLLAEGVAAAVQQQARELLGLCALATGAGGEAIAALQQALAVAPAAERPRLSFALGEAHAQQEQWAEAAKAYDGVPADAPGELRGDALYGACFALHSLGQHEASIARADAVLSLQPPHRLATHAALARAENRFAMQQYAAAEKDYAPLAEDGAHRATAGWKLAWCRYLQQDAAGAAKRFAAIAADAQSPHAEEALAMQALAELESGSLPAALASADRYRARYREGAFLDRTERVAARVLRQNGDLAGAEQRLTRAAAVAQARGGAQAATGDLVEQAELLYQRGDFKAADAAFAQLERHPDATGARALAGRAWCAFELGDDDACSKALAAAKAHGAAVAELPGLLELESALHHRREDWPAAIATAKGFLRQFAAHGKAPAMRYALGIAEARSGDAKSASATLGALVKDGGYERPDRLQYELALACRKVGDEAGALAAFQQSADSADVEIAGDSRHQLGLHALAQKDLVAARRWLGSVEGTARPHAWYRLAFAEFEAAGSDRQQLAAARERFVQVAAAGSGELVGEARYFVAECCVRLDDDTGAIAATRELVKAEPAHPRAAAARLLLGECALRQRQPDVVVEALEPFLRGEGQARADLARANLWLGRARVLRKEYDQAEACLLRTTELSDGPLGAEAQFRLGESREARGELRGAADAYVQLPILYAHAEWVRRGLLHAGLVYERLQQPDKAQRFFRELVDQHAGSAEAKTAGERLRPN